MLFALGSLDHGRRALPVELVGGFDCECILLLVVLLLRQHVELLLVYRRIVSCLAELLLVL